MGFLEHFWEQPVPWIEEGPESDVVLASRVRLARNLNGYPFPHHARAEKMDEVVTKLEEAVLSLQVVPGENFVRNRNLSAEDRQLLLERRLISPEFAQSTDHRAVAFDKRGRFSLMVNEEDHIRMQIIDSGLDLELLWDELHDTDVRLRQRLDVAYQFEFGYLTACPTNTGTGMRVSVLVHLPALDATGRIKEVLSQQPPSGIAVRGFYGEGSDVVGNIFQISNRLTLGWTEYRLLEDLLKIAQEIVDKEREARAELLEKRPIDVEDRIFRSLGILERARKISSREFIEHFSNLMLGIHIGIIQDIDEGTLRRLLVWVQPAHLQLHLGKEMPAADRDIYRAEFVRAQLGIG
jgi:protein arginine kinase